MLKSAKEKDLLATEWHVPWYWINETGLSLQQYKAGLFLYDRDSSTVYRRKTFYLTLRETRPSLSCYHTLPPNKKKTPDLRLLLLKLSKCPLQTSSSIYSWLMCLVWSETYRTHLMCYRDLVLQRENQQKLRQIGQELSNVDASANRLKSLEEELQRAVCIKLSNLLTHQLAHQSLIHS